MYYTSMLRCCQLLRILVRTNHPCLRVGRHTTPAALSSARRPTPLCVLTIVPCSALRAVQHWVHRTLCSPTTVAPLCAVTSHRQHPVTEPSSAAAASSSTAAIFFTVSIHRCWPPPTRSGPYDSAHDSVSVPCGSLTPSLATSTLPPALPWHPLRSDRHRHGAGPSRWAPYRFFPQISSLSHPTALAAVPRWPSHQPAPDFSRCHRPCAMERCSLVPIWASRFQPISAQ
jgi:hypothetical protein